MQEEFLGVHKRFDDMDKRFIMVEADLFVIKGRLGIVESQVKEMKKSAGELFTKLDGFMALYRDAKQELTVLAKQVRRLEERIAQLESKK